MTTRLLTVSNFLRTKFARDAAEASGNSVIGDFSPDSDGLIGRAMRGAYTLPELDALSADLRAVQVAYNTLTLAAVSERIRELYAERDGLAYTKLRAPSHWASYLINGDASGLSADDVIAVSDWLKSLDLGEPIDCTEAGFTWFHDALDFALAADCHEYTFRAPQSRELEAVDEELAALGDGMPAKALAALRVRS